MTLPIHSIADRTDEFEFECNALATEGQQVIEDNLKFRVTTSGNGLVIKVSYEQETGTSLVICVCTERYG